MALRFHRPRPISAAPCQSSGALLVAIVVTHDRLAHLRRTVRALLDSPPSELAALVVVDNASCDDTRAWLACVADPRLHVLRLGRNMGGAGGFAVGLRYARRRFGADWLLLMDDDARPEPGALRAFHASDLTGWDAIAGAVYLPDGAICDLNRPSWNPFANWRSFLHTALRGREGFHLDAAAYAGRRIVPVDAASYVGLFLSRRALDLAGPPDRRLFIYCDDMLQTLQLTRAGGRIGFHPALRFEHDMPRNAAGAVRVPLWKNYYKIRNSLILYRAAAGWLFGPICLIALPRWLAGAWAFPGQRRAFLRLFRHAVWHGLCDDRRTGHAQVLAWADGGADDPLPAHQDTLTLCSARNSVPSSCVQTNSKSPGAAART